MNKHIKIIILSLIVLLLYTSSVIACGPGFPEYIYDSSQILDDYYPLISGMDGTDPQNDPILNNNFEIIAPLWGPEYMLPVYLASKNKELSADIKKALVNSDTDQSSIYFNKSTDIENSVKNWAIARNKYSNVDDKELQLIIDDYPSYIDETTDIRFQNAANKLTDLGSRFNQDQLAQWINYQDQMFKIISNGDNGFPELQVNLVSPSAWQKFILSINKLLKISTTNKYLPQEMVYENEYQLAAIEYYKENYDKAIDMFGNISKEKNSSRREDAILSTGWSYIAKANQQHESDLKAESKYAEKNYLENLKTAQTYYKKIIADFSLSKIKSEANKYLDYVLYRTDPVARLTRAGEVLLTTVDPKEYTRNMDDYITLWYKYFYNHIANQKDVPEYDQYIKKIKESGDEFSQFLLAWTDSKSNSLEENIDKYKETQSPLWLILAQRQVSPNDQQWSYVDGEIKKLTTTSPFYLTAQYYYLDSQSSDSKLKDSTKKSIENLITQTEKNKQYAAQNLFKGLMFDLSDSLIEKQKYSVMNSLNYYWSYHDLISRVPYYSYVKSEPKERQFFVSKAMKQTLISTNLDKYNELLSSENVFTPKIKQYFRLILFVKATIENRFDISKNMATLLAKNNIEISKDISPFIKSQDVKEQKFLAAKFILDYPGITDVSNDNFDEFQLGGVSEIKSIDNFQRNWDVGFNNAVLKDSIKKENKIGEMVDSTVIDFASKNPQYRLVPEALSKLVDFAHFGPGTSGQRAFQLLHTNYPGSYWAKQTPYWYE